MSSLKIYCTKSRYGWKKDSQVAGGDTCYVGRVYNNTNTRHYDSSLRFIPPSNPDWGDNPIIISEVILRTVGKSKTPYNNLNVYLSTTEASYPGSFVQTPAGSIAIFNSSSVHINNSEALKQINEYLVSKTTFYLHINRDIDGGILYGGASGDNRPYIIIVWDYAASTGTLDKTNFLVGDTVNLTLDVKGSGYKHEIKCYIKKSNMEEIEVFPTFTNGELSEENINQAIEPGIYIDSMTFSPSISEIDSWFSTDSATSEGYFKIITKREDEKIGESTVPFSISLTGDYCKNKNYLTLTSNNIDFNYRAGQKIDAFLANRSYITTKGSYTKNGNATITSINLTVTKGLLGTQTKEFTEGQEIKLETVIGTQPLQATLTLVDSRGLIYTASATSSTPTKYTELQLLNLNFYRSDGSKAFVLGTKIGCNFKVKFFNKLENQISEIFVGYTPSDNNTLFSEKLSGSSYSSTNLFDNNQNQYIFSTSLSYNLVIYIKDKVTSDSTLYGYNNYSNGYYTYSIDIPKSEYIIHIPRGGKGIAFGTAYTDTSNIPYIDCGWDLRRVYADGTISGLGIPSGGTGATTIQGAQENLNILPTTGGVVTGAIDLDVNDPTPRNKARIRATYLEDGEVKNQALVSYKSTSYEAGTCLAASNAPTLIRGTDLYFGSSDTNKKEIGVIGKNIFFAENNGSGAPVGITAKEGMIWLCPVD